MREHTGGSKRFPKLQVHLGVTKQKGRHFSESADSVAGARYSVHPPKNEKG